MSVKTNYSSSSIANESKFVSSFEEFHEKYSVNVDKGLIAVTDKISKLVLAEFTTNKDQQQYSDVYNPSHFHNGIFYFVLSSEKYVKAKYVYSFDLSIKSIKCILSPAQDPHFVESRLVNFGSGFNLPGNQLYNFSGTGVITIYDLTIQQGTKEVKKHFVENGSNGGWDGGIDENTKEVTAFDHITGEKYRFPIFDKI